MSKKILAVDDAPEVTELIRRFLTDLGYEVRCLNDPREVMSVIASFRPELCILDMHMPYMGGSELLDAIKTADSMTEIIFLTAEDDTITAVESMRRGAAHYLLKPVSLRKMEMSVAKALEHHQLVTENVAYKKRLEDLVTERTEALNRALMMLSNVHTATLDILATALDFRDQATHGHSRRMADLTVGIAKEMGISGNSLMQVEHGALLHDIGKLRIPDSILWHPGELSPQQWEVMRKHPEYGFEFLNKIGFLQEAAQLVLCHHEKYDGTGYPRGLRAKEIPLEARIFALIDSVDALIYDRPYHRAIPFEEACERILRGSGTHYDPELVGPVLDHLARKLPEHLNRQPTSNPE
jgi:putative nucleotidyltransferase with HDIG domain